MENNEELSTFTVVIDGKKFNAYKMSINATLENWDRVSEFINYHLDNANCPFSLKFQIETAVEEIYVNIARYAYPGKLGKAEIILKIDEQISCVAITFIDSGIPYNPLNRDDPDITLSAEERKIGGLGILMVKKMMDDVSYKYENGCNNFTMSKNLK